MSTDSTETWYVMEDGTMGDPRLIGQGADGVLRHADGRAVAYAPHGPRSRGGVDAAAERAKAAATAARGASAPIGTGRENPPADDRELTAESPPAPAKRRYKTRAGTAD